jgi:replication factor C small subunit
MAMSEVMWVEKYRPRNLDEVINHEEVVRRMKEFLKDPASLPHLLFAGPPGNGKTTVALCVARQLYGKLWRELTLELNASDERGIKVVRERIKHFSRLGAMGGTFRLIILDEADELTPEAQTALRRIMEQSSRTCRFILICNYSSRIIEPIQSRCAIFRFVELERRDVVNCLKRIAEGEGVKLTRDGIEAIWDFCGGDLRRAINTLQAASVLGRVVTEDSVVKVIGKVRPREVRSMLEDAMRGDFLAARGKLYKLLFSYGFPAGEVLREINQEVYKLDLTSEELAKLAELIGEYDYRLMEGANSDLQLSALLARISALRRHG